MEREKTESCARTHFNKFEQILEEFLVVDGNQIILPGHTVVLDLGVVTEQHKNKWVKSER